MPTIVKAEEGDSLCGLAMAAGFLNCTPIRNEPANAGKGFLTRSLKKGDVVTIPDIKKSTVRKAAEALHIFTKKNAPPLTLRFTHGSKDKPYRQDKSEEALNVSNWPTDKGGSEANLSFPPGTKFDQDGHDDPDTFKLEVVDPAASGPVQVELRALKPVYAADGTIERHEPFTGAEETRRKTTVTCEVVPSKVCFRSPYLRLVVDDDDGKAAGKQTLLVTDMADGKQGDADKVEILDQRVQASYTHQKCPASQKCVAVKTLSVGRDHQRAKVAVHILKDATGKAVADAVLTRKRILNYVRQLYAQADLGIKILEPIREVPLPANMFTIANANGRRAVGNKTVQVRVRIDATVDQTVSITTNPNDKPIGTANALAAAVQSVLPSGMKIEASENPPLIGQTIGSADVLIGDPTTQKILLNVLTSDDVAHKVAVGQLASATVKEFVGNDSHVGTIEERVLLKNYDTGNDRIDLFIADNLSDGDLGEAFTPNFTEPKKRRPLASIVNSAIVFADTIRKADYYHTTVPHEMGHILMDCSHAETATEMMGAGSPVGSKERVVNGPKRISDPRKIKYDNGVRGVPVEQIRNANKTLLDGW